MKLSILQEQNRRSIAEMKAPFRSGAEVMLALTEEFGEVAQEVALLEQIGSKAEWSKSPSVERLAEEITHLLNLAVTLADLYGINLESLYTGQSAPHASNGGMSALDNQMMDMANDPDIQRELQQIEAEFAMVAWDGLSPEL